ncbi:MAG: hypothetical protein RMM98_09780 [Acidobacteriota bacterium]|nr:hypothetical protein [Blastocatellia bacterium]MDW8239892.1 hypothetical protein [Acidobacteriota bacterium]
MNDVDYVGAIVGSSLGVLGAITGVLGSLAKMNPEKHLGKLRIMVWFDIGLGCFLAAVGIVTWLRSSTDYGYDLAETLFFSGVATVGVVGTAASEVIPEARRFAYTLLPSGLIFVALSVYSHLTHAPPGRKSRELTWGVMLLIFYVIAKLWHNLITRRRTETRS